jgi:hypothetical protein
MINNKTVIHALDDKTSYFAIYGPWPVIFHLIAIAIAWGMSPIKANNIAGLKAFSFWNDTL